jgi:hypothetical protein
MTENYEWRVIPGYERYEASEHGQVRRAAAGHGSQPGHVLRAKRNKHGHLYVSVASANHRPLPMSVHRLICMTFHGPQPSPDHIVLHENDVPDDNRKENLRWGTHADNARDRERNSRRKISEIGTWLARDPKASFLRGEISQQEARDIARMSMTYRKQSRAVK